MMGMWPYCASSSRSLCLNVLIMMPSMFMRSSTRTVSLMGSAAAELDVVGGQEYGRAAQLTEALLEGYAGTRGGLGEYHRERLAAQVFVRLVRVLFLFKLDGAFEYLPYLLGGVIHESEHMLVGNACLWACNR